jgi:transposase
LRYLSLGTLILGYGSEAQFAALVGVAPIPASSGKTTRHRLSRGGDRHANHAPYQVVLVRMASCQWIKDYVTFLRNDTLAMTYR